MSLVDRDDYDALARASRQMHVFERVLNPKHKSTVKKVGRGCFDCEHSVGAMSPDKRYTTIWFYAYEDHMHWDEEPGYFLQSGQTLFPRIGVVVSPEDKYYREQTHPLNGSMMSWEPPTSIIVTQMDVSQVSISTIYVRQLVEYDEDGYMTKAPSHINKRIDLNSYFSENPKILIVSTSSYIRGTYVDLEALPRLRPNGKYWLTKSFRMTDAGWGMFKRYLPDAKKPAGPTLVALEEKGSKKKRKEPSYHYEQLADGINTNNGSIWNTAAVNTTIQGDS